MGGPSAVSGATAQRQTVIAEDKYPMKYDDLDTCDSSVASCNYGPSTQANLTPWVTTGATFLLAAAAAKYFNHAQSRSNQSYYDTTLKMGDQLSLRAEGEGAKGQDLIATDPLAATFYMSWAALHSQDALFYYEQILPSSDTRISHVKYNKDDWYGHQAKQLFSQISSDYQNTIEYQLVTTGTVNTKNPFSSLAYTVYTQLPPDTPLAERFSLLTLALDGYAAVSISTLDRPLSQLRAQLYQYAELTQQIESLRQAGSISLTLFPLLSQRLEVLQRITTIAQDPKVLTLLGNQPILREVGNIITELGEISFTAIATTPAETIIGIPESRRDATILKREADHLRETSRKAFSLRHQFRLRTSERAERQGQLEVARRFRTLIVDELNAHKDHKDHKDMYHPFDRIRALVDLARVELKLGQLDAADAHLNEGIAIDSGFLKDHIYYNLRAQLVEQRLSRVASPIQSDVARDPQAAAQALTEYERLQSEVVTIHNEWLRKYLFLERQTKPIKQEMQHHAEAAIRSFEIFLDSQTLGSASLVERSQYLIREARELGFSNLADEVTLKIASLPLSPTAILQCENPMEMAAFYSQAIQMSTTENTTTFDTAALISNYALINRQAGGSTYDFLNHILGELRLLLRPEHFEALARELSFLTSIEQRSIGTLLDSTTLANIIDAYIHRSRSLEPTSAPNALSLPTIQWLERTRSALPPATIMTEYGQFVADWTLPANLQQPASRAEESRARTDRVAP